MDLYLTTSASTFVFSDHLVRDAAPPLIWSIADKHQYSCVSVFSSNFCNKNMHESSLLAEIA